MTSLYIICEGSSEQSFIDKVLKPYISIHNPRIDISAPILKDHKTKNQSHKGGRVSYARLKSYVEHFAKQQRQCKITTFVDYYGLINDFPNYNNIQKIQDIYGRIEKLESEITNAINSPNFIPYIQIHEYEMFYFADLDNFIKTDPQLNNIKKDFIAINDKINNPELINNSVHTAPSKRIEQIFEQIKLKYSKTFYANLYTSTHCDIQILRDKCSHFNSWIDKLLNLN